MKIKLIYLFILMFVIASSDGKPTFFLGKGFDKETRKIINPTNTFKQADDLYFVVENKKPFKAMDYNYMVHKKDKNTFELVYKDKEELSPEFRGFYRYFPCSSFDKGTHKITVIIKEIFISQEFTVE